MESPKFKHDSKTVLQSVPPVPGKTYNVAVNGSATGPFDLNTLAQMVVTGAFLRESLVWSEGMTEWKKAEEIDELKTLFPTMPPIPQ
jgi:hypothetical protein